MLFVQDSALAQDLVQEAFLRVWRSPRTPHDADGFRRWLYKAIVNLARDHHRKRVLGATLQFWSPPSRDPADEVDRRLTTSALERAIASLRRKEREALYLRYFEDAPFEEVAATLGIGVTAARVRVHRALHRLRDRMRADGIWTEGLT
jgi:RNA polymerase sigma-70 factor (ECF subfamily)